MNPSSLFIEIEHVQRKKRQEAVCGDAFTSRQFLPEQRKIAVLSDGLGSGVKANILSCMTAEMAIRFVASDKDIQDAVKLIMNVLPVCRVRRISYATLSIVDTLYSGETRIVEMGNPPILYVRGDRLVDLAYQEFTSPAWHNRALRVATASIQPGDRIIMMSDGITQAGLGTDEHKLGWRIQGCWEFVREQIAADRNISARSLASSIMKKALSHERRFQPHDDMTCAVMYFREPRRMMVMTGPPYHKERDQEMAARLNDFSGKKVICGGTTANIIARELGRAIQTPLKRCGDLPPPSYIGGIDLVTEGILTLSRTFQLLKVRDAAGDHTAAAEFVELLRESDVIDFYVGTRINDAHQDPSLPRELEIRRNIVKQIAKILEEQYLKKIQLHYI